MREPKQKRSQRTLAKILTAAVELFDSKGVDATAINDVATRADSSVGSIYGRFDGKTDLVQAVDRLLWDRVAARWSAAGTSESVDSQEPTEAGLGRTGGLGVDGPSEVNALLTRLHRSLTPEHRARASIDDFLVREGAESAGMAVRLLLITEVHDALTAQLPSAPSGPDGTSVLRFLARVAVEEANRGHGVDAPIDATPVEIASLSAGDTFESEPPSDQLSFVIDATLNELGGTDRAPAPETKRAAPPVDPFDIWA